MIRQVRVENYKSIPDLALDLGRVTVLIGANGSGKSNILEAIALASAAAQNKLDNEFLVSRGIRVTETRYMYSAFDNSIEPSKHPYGLKFGFQGDNKATIEKNDVSDTINISVRRDNQVSFASEIFADETTSF